MRIKTYFSYYIPHIWKIRQCFYPSIAQSLHKIRVAWFFTFWHSPYITFLYFTFTPQYFIHLHIHRHTSPIHLRKPPLKKLIAADWHGWFLVSYYKIHTEQVDTNMGHNKWRITTSPWKIINSSTYSIGTLRGKPTFLAELVALEYSSNQKRTIHTKFQVSRTINCHLWTSNYHTVSQITYTTNHSYHNHFIDYK